MNRGSSGFAMLELIVCAALSVTLAVTAFFTLQSYQKMHKRLLEASLRFSQQRTIETTLRQKLSNVLRLKAPLQPTGFSWVTVDHRTFSYQYALATSQLTLTEENGGPVLSRAVTDVTFFYFDKDGLATTNPAEVALVSVVCNVTAGESTAAFRVTLWLKNSGLIT